MEILKLCILIILVAFTANARDSRFKLWQNQSLPTLDQPESIGGYGAGCLKGAIPLELEGPGFVMLQPSLKRNFGHPNMIQYLRELGTKIYENQAPAMLIEDMAGAKGGPVASGHMSHQNGLDVDISLLMVNAEGLSQREKIISLSFVDAVDKTKVSKYWKDSEQSLLISEAAKSSWVQRIFVAPAIKKYFCEKFRNEPWLYKLRAMDGHDDHIHVRLHCPKDSPNCEPQEEVNPSDIQCGEGLRDSFAYWRTGVLATSKGPSVSGDADQNFPNLPAECSSMIREQLK